MEDVKEELNEGMSIITSHNNVGILKEFKIPEGWVQDFWRYDFAWRSPNLGVDVNAVTVSYKKWMKMMKIRKIDKNLNCLEFDCIL